MTDKQSALNAINTKLALLKVSVDTGGTPYGNVPCQNFRSGK